MIETAPGEEAQVDYGAGPMVRDPHTGKYRTRLFVLDFGYSQVGSAVGGPLGFCKPGPSCMSRPFAG